MSELSYSIIPSAGLTQEVMAKMIDRLPCVEYEGKRYFWVISDSDPGLTGQDMFVIDVKTGTLLNVDEDDVPDEVQDFIESF